MTKFIIRSFTLVFAMAAFIMTATAHEQTHGDLVLHHAWARATPGGAKTGAAYVRIENHGMAADRIIAAASPIAAKVEIHAMSMENDVMTMAPAGDVEIPAHGIVELKPHGLHIMLMGLKQPLKEGDTFPVTLTFEKTGPVDLQIVVEATDSTGAGHDGPEDGEEHTH